MAELFSLVAARAAKDGKKPGPVRDEAFELLKVQQAVYAALAAYDVAAGRKATKKLLMGIMIERRTD